MTPSAQAPKSARSADAAAKREALAAHPQASAKAAKKDVARASDDGLVEEDTHSDAQERKRAEPSAMLAREGAGVRLRVGEGTHTLLLLLDAAGNATVLLRTGTAIDRYFPVARDRLALAITAPHPFSLADLAELRDMASKKEVFNRGMLVQLPPGLSQSALRAP
jgi:hypothetical protein